MRRDERSFGNGTTSGVSRNVEGVCTQFVVAQALVIFKWYGAKLATVAFIVLLLFVLGDYWLLQSMLWKKITTCNIDVNVASAWGACGHQNNCPAVV